MLSDPRHVFGVCAGEVVTDQRGDASMRELVENVARIGWIDVRCLLEASGQVIQDDGALLLVKSDLPMDVNCSECGWHDGV